MRRVGIMALGGAFVWIGAASAQFGRGSDWVTSGNDVQRSAWVRSDAKISRDSLQQPGFQLLWKVKLSPNGPDAQSQPVILNRYIGYRGFRSLSFQGGSRNTVSAVDTDLARVEWRRQLAASGAGCGRDLLVSVTRPTQPEFPSAVMSRGFGRGGPAAGAVGEPGEGAVTLKLTRAAFRMPRPAPPRRLPNGRTRRELPGLFGGRPMYLFALDESGALHTMYVSNGEEPAPPEKFLPSGAAARGLMVVDGAAYAVTEPGCGQAPHAVWALDLDSKQVATWKAHGPIAGADGPAMGPDGTLYVATGAGDGRIVALEPGTLKLKDWYTSPGQAFTTSPVIFQYRNKALLAAAARDGSLVLLDTASLGGPNHDKPLAKTAAVPGGAAGALAAFQEGASHWLLAPGASSLQAYKVVERNGAPALEAAWRSPEIAAPSAPLVMNGVVFDLSTAAHRLFALDSISGKELWNSGKSLSSAVSTEALAAGEGQIYVGTRDGFLYAFGFPMEH